jgi:O-antigen ligase
MPRAIFADSIPRDPLRIALAMLVFLDIGRLHMHLGFGWARPGVALAFLAIGYVVLNPASISLRSFRVGLTWLVALLGLQALVSLPFGISPGGAAAFFVDNYSKVLISAGLLLLATRGLRDTTGWVMAFLAGSAMLVWYALFVFDLNTVNSLTQRLDNLYTYDANDVGLILVVAVPMCLWLLDVAGPKTKMAAAVLLGGSVWAIARTGSRGAFVALAFVVVGTVLFALGRLSIAKRIIGLAVVAVALLLAAPPGYWNQMATITSVQEDYNWSSDTGRKAIALRGVGYMVQYPLFGVGLHNFPRAEGTISSMVTDAMPGQGVPWTAPHNSYLQVGAELGIPGAVAFVLLVFGGLFGMIGVARRAARQGALERSDAYRSLEVAARYLALSYLGFAVGASFLSFAYLAPIYILTAMAVGLHLEERRLLAGRAPRAVLTGRPERSRVPSGTRGGLAASEGFEGRRHAPPRTGLPGRDATALPGR